MSGTERDRHIVFSIENIIYSSPLSSVSKILELKDYDKIPYTPDFLLGETYHEDKNIYIVDLKKIFKRAEDSEHGKIRLIYKSYPHSVSIVADSLEKITELDNQTIHQDKLFKTNDSKLIKGSYRYKDNTAFIVDISGVMDMEYFQKIEIESETEQSEENQQEVDSE